MSDIERYCIACGYAKCRCGKNYHPTVNEVHAMYLRVAELEAAIEVAVDQWVIHPWCKEAMDEAIDILRELTASEGSEKANDQ